MTLKVPLVHLFLNVLIDVVQFSLQLLPPLLRWQVAEVFWPGALVGQTREQMQRKRNERGLNNRGLPLGC